MRREASSKLYIGVDLDMRPIETENGDCQNSVSRGAYFLCLGGHFGNASASQVDFDKLHSFPLHLPSIFCDPILLAANKLEGKREVSPLIDAKQGFCLPGVFFAAVPLAANKMEGK